MKKFTTCLAIPTYRAERYLDVLLPSIERQSLKVDHFLVVDSSSPDNSVRILRDFGAEVHVIPQSAFDHGGTRQWMAEHVTGTDIIIFLTQDALPADADCFSEIVGAFDDPAIAMAYGRQLPRKDAGPIEAHARIANYPAEPQIVTAASAQGLGLKAVFCSNSFAAYRREALIALGGFPQKTLFAEDAIIAAKALMAGWSKAYVPQACVYHSHAYSIVQDFKRNFDIGVFHQQEKWIIDHFGWAEGEGMKFILSELRYLARHAPYLIPSAMVRNVVKYTAYQLGRRYERRSPRWNRWFSLNGAHWFDSHPNTKIM